MGKEQIVQAVLVTYELMGQTLSDMAARATVQDLAGFSEPDVITALTRCRKELRKITLADILDRIPTGHPGAEEAWAMVSGILENEGLSIVWTDEMAEAFGVARHLADDKIAARMAFKESYSKALARVRDEKKLPAWRLSLGLDPSGRQGVIEEAVRLGRLSIDQARKVLPGHSFSEELAKINGREVLGITGR